jgi:hypothetical protein
MNGNDSQEIEKANPSERRKVLLLLVAVGACGIAAILGIQWYIGQVLELNKEDPEAAFRKLSFVAKLVAVVISMSLILFAAWLGRLSRKVYRSGRFPPPGAKVVRDTRIVTGPSAKIRAGIGFALAAITGAAALLVPVFVWRLLSRLPE